MTDRELLEKAAKAAGLTLTWDGDNPPYPRARSADEPYWNPHWNPLTDDGAALRLAVLVGEPFVVRTRCVTTAGGLMENFDPAILGDDLRATRRVIVRAAASMLRGDT